MTILEVDLREPNAPREPGITRLTKIPIRDNGEPLVDLCRECPGIVVSACPTYARRSIAGMLNHAQSLLPEGIKLRVHTALRTTEMQSNGYWGHFKSLQEKHPEWPKSIVRREANKFWHPPDVPKAPPGHCTGGAVDVALLDAEDNRIDVTSVAKEGADAQPTYALHLTPVAKANRALLIRVMTEAGFSNCYDEWWHWSFGDCAWAVRLGFPEAIYGWVTELPDGVLKQIEEAKRRKEEEEAAKAAEEKATEAAS
jgi:D-alanyl-D-alanine dipeptidase